MQSRGASIITQLHWWVALVEAWLLRWVTLIEAWLLSRLSSLFGSLLTRCAQNDSILISYLRSRTQNQPPLMKVWPSNVWTFLLWRGSYGMACEGWYLLLHLGYTSKILVMPLLSITLVVMGSCFSKADRFTMQVLPSFPLFWKSIMQHWLEDIIVLLRHVRLLLPTSFGTEWNKAS